MIDTGQINGRCAMGNPNYGDYEKETGKLGENSKRNQIEGQQPHQRKVNRRSGEAPIAQNGSDKDYLGNINKKDNNNRNGTKFEYLKPGWKKQNTDDLKGRKENDDDEMREEKEVQFENREEMKGEDMCNEKYNVLRKVYL